MRTITYKNQRTIAFLEVETHIETHIETQVDAFLSSSPGAESIKYYALPERQGPVGLGLHPASRWPAETCVFPQNSSFLAGLLYHARSTRILPSTHRLHWW